MGQRSGLIRQHHETARTEIEVALIEIGKICRREKILYGGKIRRYPDSAFLDIIETNLVGIPGDEIQIAG